MFQIEDLFLPRLSSLADVRSKLWVKNLIPGPGSDLGLHLPLSKVTSPGEQAVQTENRCLQFTLDLKRFPSDLWLWHGLILYNPKSSPICFTWPLRNHQNCLLHRFGRIPQDVSPSTHQASSGSLISFLIFWAPLGSSVLMFSWSNVPKPDRQKIETGCCTRFLHVELCLSSVSVVIWEHIAWATQAAQSYGLLPTRAKSPVYWGYSIKLQVHFLSCEGLSKSVSLLYRCAWSEPWSARTGHFLWGKWKRRIWVSVFWEIPVSLERRSLSRQMSYQLSVNGPETSCKGTCRTSKHLELESDGCSAWQVKTALYFGVRHTQALK